MGPFHPYAPMPRPPPKTEAKAVMSLVLGLLSLACIGAFAGLPAIVLGALARRDIDRSRGTLSGRALAAGGIVSGLFGTGIGIVVALIVVSSLLQPATQATAESTSEPAPSIVPVASGTRSYGSLEVVDLDGAHPLAPQLAEVAARGGASGRTVILQTYHRRSSACAAVAASLPDARMQRALANVTLVRVDVESFRGELGSMRVETETAPWFYKLDAAARPTDAISADAWGDNVPENMAPVLGRFARGLGRRAAR
jgi:uncharacterized protein DUF4190